MSARETTVHTSFGERILFRRKQRNFSGHFTSTARPRSIITALQDERSIGMNAYTTPEMEIIVFAAEDVINGSPVLDPTLPVAGDE